MFWLSFEHWSVFIMGLFSQFVVETCNHEVSLFKLLKSMTIIKFVSDKAQ